ncbi:YgjV family protein [Endozoicomonas ascidiicola]|uniref:YgjV family protein n=1 Tax=Endozoicomonas ascidiicola TaxID=1698521 RepID=UPI000836E554|nr:YgjV family protein [Endozoicomonas ascidiicola]
MLAAQIIGVIAFLIGVLAFWQKDDNKFRYQMGIYCLIMTAHFAMIGANVAAMNALINGVRNCISAKIKTQWIMIFFIVLILALSIPRVSVWFELLTVAGSLATTWALFSIQGIPLRLVMLFSSCCWLTHNLFAGSIGGSMIEATFVVSNIVTIYKMLKMERLLIETEA